MIQYETDFSYDKVIKLIKQSKHFRYFESRNENIFNSHLYHVLLKDKSSYVGYGHLDAELNKLWLGMCIFDSHQSKGYGKAILNHLLNIQTQYPKINLTVDKENFRAVNLYISNGFRIITQTDRIYYCERNYNV